MRKLLICMLLIASPAFAIDGNKLKEYMLGQEAFGASNSNYSNCYPAGAFYGYVAGVSDDQIGRLWCPRQGVTYGQQMAVVAKFLRDHPEWLDADANLLVISALQLAFPCPKK